MPNYGKFMKDVLSRKRRVDEDKPMKLMASSAILQANITQKHKDLGSYTILCCTENSTFSKALCDLGARKFEA